jgi:hypothetical protein
MTEYTKRERKLLRSCLEYGRDPSGLPGSALMLLVYKMFIDLSGRPGGPVVKPLPYPTYAEGDDE